MRKVLPVFLLLASLFAFTGLSAQQLIIGSVGKATTQMKSPVVANATPSGFLQHTTSKLPAFVSVDQFKAPAPKASAGGMGMQTLTANCGPDTVRYPQAKASGLFAFALGANGAATGFAQWYPAPQTMQVRGFEFFAWVDSATNQTVNLNCQLWAAGNDSLPTGNALASVIVTIDSTFSPGTLNSLAKYAIFSSAVTVNTDYVLTITSTSAINVGILSNDPNANDGGGEDLALFNNTGWAKLFSGAGVNADWLYHPIVTYAITAGFTAPNSVCTTTPVNFVNTTSPIVNSRFYNQAAFIGQPQLSYTWDFGDGTSGINLVNPSHTYASTGTFTVSQVDTMFMWTGLCVDSTSSTISVGTGTSVTPSFTYAATGLTVAFTDATTGSPTGWSWDFGDGSAAVTTQNPSHTYAAAGTYTVCLTASNACGPVTACQQVIVGAPPSSSCDTLVNISGNAVLYNTTTGGYVAGNNPGGDSVKAEFFANPGPFAVAEALVWFGAKEGTNGVTVHVYDATGTGGAPGNSLGSQALTHAQLDTTGALTSVVFNPPIAVTGDFYVGVELSQASGDTIGIVSNLNGQTVPATAWEKTSTGAWQRFDATTSWGLSVSLGIWAIQGIQANYTSSVATLTATFTDQSIGAAAWLWDFGDGNTSTQQNPTHTYATGGNYNVCLVAINSTCVDTFCTTVNVSCTNPVAAFSNSGSNLAYNFTDNSTGTPTQWLWDFGDGTTSTAQNPSHIYAAAGTYTVCLGVQNGCGADTTCTTITVTCTAPTAAYSSLSGTGTNVSFTDASTGTPTSWLWDFGDGTTSNAQNPNKTYTTAGFYTVCLTVTNVCGTDSTCMTVTAGCPVPVAAWTNATSGNTVNFTDQTVGSPTSWTWDFGDGSAGSSQQNPTHTYSTSQNYTVCLIVSNACGADTICNVIPTGCNTPVSGFTNTANLLQVNFTDATTNTPTAWAWDFGDGNSSTTQSPTHTYANPGTYNVCLTATNSCGNSVSCTNVTVVCPTPVSGFTFTSTQLNATFTDGSTGSPATWSWNFGDGSTSNQQSPSHTYASSGNYTVCLTTTNPCGTDVSCQSVSIVCPTPNTSFTSTVTNFGANFTDNSTGATTWEWDFGDGTTSTQQSPSHTYAANGSYTVCLKTTNGCGTDSLCQTVSINCPAPTAGFTHVANVLSVAFTNQSSNGVFQWAWDFGDGNTSTNPNPSHTYALSGSYLVCLTVTNACGTNQVCQVVSVVCPTPFVNFNFVTLGNQVNFTNLSNGSGIPGSTSFWDFGDGATSTAHSPSHSYQATGTYTACLIVTNSCGPDTFCRTVVISCVPPQSNFAASVSNNVVNVQNQASGNSTAWNWDFGDGTTSTAQNPAPHAYGAAGTYNVCLTVTNPCGTDTYCSTVTISCTMPTSAFTLNNSGGVVTFTDISVDPVSWQWNFGDGSNSTQQNPTHSYTNSGTFQVCLTVTNFCGSHTSCQNVIVNCQPPASAFTYAQGSGAVNFTDNTSGQVTGWLWDFGDGVTDTTQNPSHGYIFSGIFQVCLTTYNNCGSNTSCQNVLVTTINIDDELGSALRIYPNPSEGRFNLESDFQDPAELSWEVTNLLGERLLGRTEGTLSGSFRREIDLSGFANGVYLLHLRSGDRAVTRKLIKE